MALTEGTKIDKVEILEDGQIQVREADIIYRDGVEISRSYSRYVLDPGTHTMGDVASAAAGKSGVDIQSIVTALWKPAIVSARKTALAAMTGPVTPPQRPNV